MALAQEKVQAAEALKAEAQLKRAMAERDHMRRLEAVRDSNRRKTLRDAVAWLRQAARTPHEANMHRSVAACTTHHSISGMAFDRKGKRPMTSRVIARMVAHLWNTWYYNYVL